jgi:polar amino acid transport system substrate-binding protein
MRRQHYIKLLAFLTAGALVLGACGGDDNKDETSGSGSDSGSAPANVDLVSSGKLTVCSDTPYEPFEFQKDGKDVGYDIDILRAIATDNNLDLEVKDLPFDGILGSLAAGDCDVVGSAVTITDDRAKQVDFSDPYFDADQSLLVKAADKDKYAKLTDLTGQTIGVQSSTTGEAYAKDHKPQGATIKSFDDATGLFGAIASGQIAAILQDFPVNAYRATQDDSVVVTETFPTGEQYGFAIKKGNSDMLALINDGLKSLKDSGKFDDIYGTYFGEKK